MSVTQLFYSKFNIDTVKILTQIKFPGDRAYYLKAFEASYIHARDQQMNIMRAFVGDYTFQFIICRIML